MSMPLTGQDWETVILSKPKNHSSEGSNTHKPPIKLTAEQIRLNKLENEEIVEQKNLQELRKKSNKHEVARK